jgi:hypothetical protein
MLKVYEYSDQFSGPIHPPNFYLKYILGGELCYQILSEIQIRMINNVSNGLCFHSNEN